MELAVLGHLPRMTYLLVYDLDGDSQSVVQEFMDILDPLKEPKKSHSLHYNTDSLFVLSTLVPSQVQREQAVHW